MEQTGGKPSEGIQSTPVIDVASSRIIVVYRKQDPIPGGKLHIAALNLLNGHPDLDLPVENDSLWNQVHRNRASLLLDDGRVYVAFAGPARQGDFPHGHLTVLKVIRPSKTRIFKDGFMRSTR